MLRRHGIKSNVLKIETDAIKKIINEYTNEAGVRDAERNLNKIIRKVITNHIKKSRKIIGIRIKDTDLSNYLDDELIVNEYKKDIKHTGVIHAIACNNQGGTMLDIECSNFKGNGKYTSTGSLGNVVKESINVSISYIKSNSEKFNISPTFFNENDLHIHFTEAGILKDGPSAGSAIVTVILSLIKNVKLPSDISMTGELTLKGDILKIGSLKEKAISAKRNGIKKLFIPNENIKELDKLDKDLKDSIEFIGVNNYEEIYKELFG
jgi:ATP-dependent Lon protease